MDLTFTEIAIRLIAATILTGGLGLERQIRQKPAGFRTCSLVGVGSAAMTLMGVMIALSSPGTDQTRIASIVVQGIGFLGAGVIIQSSGAIHGLTTAATLWVVASIGIACGFGLWQPALLVTGIALVLLVIFGPLDAKLDETCKDGFKGIFKKKL
jgi:putative Mg2+ transporter-C (MgtC) family protein